MTRDLDIRDVNPVFGAEIHGYEPELLLDEDVRRRLQQLFDERSVLVFRDLDIDEDAQRELVFAVIGQEPPSVDDATSKPPFLVSNKEPGGGAPYGRLLYHCDTMWAETSNPVISLYGVTVEQPSVPTMFVSMVEAWETLPEQLRTRIEGLEARHGHDHGYPNRGGDEDVIDSYYEEPHSTVTPVAHTHARTGRRLVYVSQQATMEILGLSEQENEALLEELFTHLYDRGTVIRHEWRERDLVVWDNLSTQHARGTVDLEGPARTLRKVVGPLDLASAMKTKPTFSKVS